LYIRNIIKIQKILRICSQYGLDYIFTPKNLSKNLTFTRIGNTSTVDLSQIFEITPELVTNLPRAFSINCEQTISQCQRDQLTDADLSELNGYFESIVDDFQFDIRYVGRKSDKFNDTSCYLVELVESQSQLNLVDLFYKQKLIAKMKSSIADNASLIERVEALVNPPQAPSQHEAAIDQELDSSNVNFNANEVTTLSTGSDDHAVAESLSISTRFNDETNNFNETNNLTGFNNTAKEKNDLLVAVSEVTMQSKTANTSEWNCTPVDQKKYCALIDESTQVCDATTANEADSTSKTEWNCTPADKKKYCHLIDEPTQVFDATVGEDSSDKCLDSKGTCVSLLNESAVSDFSTHMDNSFSSTKTDFDEPS